MYLQGEVLDDDGKREDLKSNTDGNKPAIY